MSGRGLPGGGLVRAHEPSDIQVVLNLRTTVSNPVVQLPSENKKINQIDSEKTLIRIHASIKSSTHPNLPVTLSTWRTPLERSPESGDDYSPVWINSALTYLRSTSNPDRRGGPPALGYRTMNRGGFSPNLRESWDFLTIPSADSGREVIVEHVLPVEKLEFTQPDDKGYMPEVKPDEGEKFLIGPDKGALGTFWWRWGDLDGDLKDKKFRSDNWSDNLDREKATGGAHWLESEGDNGFGLTMEIVNDAEIEFK